MKRRVLARSAGALALVFGLVACSEEWTATVYPNRKDITKSETVGLFPNIDECKRAATAALNTIPLSSSASPGWECARNCKASAEGLSKCDKYEQG